MGAGPPGMSSREEFNDEDMQSDPRRLRRTDQSITVRLMNRQVTGRCFRSVTQLPSSITDHLEEQYHGIPSMLSRIQKATKEANWRQLKVDIIELTNRLCGSILVDDSGNCLYDGPEHQKKERKQREAFVLLNGAETIIDVLKVDADNEATPAPRGYHSLPIAGTPAAMVKNHCLGLLRETFYSNAEIARSLSKDHEFVQLLFKVMKNHGNFDNAVGVTEEILASSTGPFDLSTIPNLSGLVQGMSYRELSYFCRLLALAVYENDEKLSLVKSVDLLELSKKRKSCTVNPVDRNQALLLGIPGFLENLLKLLRTSFTALRRWTEQMLLFSHFPSPSPVDILSMLSHLGLDWEEEASDDDNAPRPEDNNNDNSNMSPLHRNMAQKLMTLATHQVEVLFVICTLLGGNRKVEIQNKLAKMGLPDILSRFFDRMDWSNTRPHPPAEKIHGPGCECNPESSLKVQFLRVIHNFCDRDFENVENKRLLLSERERKMLPLLVSGEIPIRTSRARLSVDDSDFQRKFEEGHVKHPSSPMSPISLPSTSLDVPPLPMGPLPVPLDDKAETRRAGDEEHEDEERPKTKEERRRERANKEGGLLTKILRTFLTEKNGSTYRFWLASCLEAYLRGAEQADQLFVTHSGVLGALLSDIIGDGFRCAGSLQTSFDLVGEILKFNPKVFQVFNQMLSDDEFDQFAQVMTTNLVDSNVFLRAVVLSLERFAEVDRRAASAQDTNHKPYPFDRCRLAGFMFDKVNQTHLMKALTTVVNVGDVNQENICCLNTALVFFMFGKRRGCLDYFVNILLESERTDKVETSTLLAMSSRVKEEFAPDNPPDRLGNFHALMMWWKEYYMRRGKDCLSLEFSSHIPYTEWQEMVALLCQVLADNTKNPHSSTKGKEKVG